MQLLNNAARFCIINGPQDPEWKTPPVHVSNRKMAPKTISTARNPVKCFRLKSLWNLPPLRSKVWLVVHVNFRMCKQPRTTTNPPLRLLSCERPPAARLCFLQHWYISNRQVIDTCICPPFSALFSANSKSNIVYDSPAEAQTSNFEKVPSPLRNLSWNVRICVNANLQDKSKVNSHRVWIFSIEHIFQKQDQQNA